MNALPWSVYADALVDGGELRALSVEGGDVALDLSRWLAAADPVDERLVERARGPVLDVGCGPGRHVHALARRGVPVLGLDASRDAVRLATAGGGDAVHGDVFTHGLELGVWETVLLLDGNVGIGGDPSALLRRVRQFLTPTGRVLIETEPPGGGLRAWPIRLAHREQVSVPFPWAHVGSDAVGGIAAAAGLTVHAIWQDEGRWFADLGCAA